MVEGAGAYFEDHKETRDLGRLALRGGIASVAMQYGNAALQIATAVILLKCAGLDSLRAARSRIHEPTAPHYPLRFPDASQPAALWRPGADAWANDPARTTPRPD